MPVLLLALRKPRPIQQINQLRAVIKHNYIALPCFYQQTLFYKLTVISSCLIEVSKYQSLMHCKHRCTKRKWQIGPYLEFLGPYATLLYGTL